MDGSAYFRTEIEILPSFVTQIIVGPDIMRSRMFVLLLAGYTFIDRASQWNTLSDQMTTALGVGARINSKDGGCESST